MQCASRNNSAGSAVSHESGDGHRVGLDVREREPDVRGTDMRQQSRGFGVEADERLLAAAVVDGDGGPVEMLSDAGGKTLRDRLLRGPACGVVLVRVLYHIVFELFRNDISSKILKNDMIP